MVYEASKWIYKISGSGKFRQPRAERYLMDSNQFGLRAKKPPGTLSCEAWEGDPGGWSRFCDAN